MPPLIPQPRKKGGSEKRQREDIIPVRCTAQERATIEQRSQARGLTAAAFLRASGLDGNPGVRAQRRVPIDQQQLRQLLGQIGAIGNNLNQIARNMNTGQFGNQLDDLKQACRAYLTLRDALLEALGKKPPAPEP